MAGGRSDSGHRGGHAAAIGRILQWRAGGEAWRSLASRCDRWWQFQDAAGAHPVPVAPLAPELLGLAQAVTAYEVLTLQAARTGDRQVVLRALLANPLVRQWDLASPLLDAILAAVLVR